MGAWPAASAFMDGTHRFLMVPTTSSDRPRPSMRISITASGQSRKSISLASAMFSIS
jgi:hypothetical protein